MRISPWITLPGPNAITSILIRERQRRYDTHREDNVKTEAELGVTKPQVKECDSHQKLKEARNRFSLRASGGTIALLTP